MPRPGLAHVRDVMQSNRLIQKHIKQRERESALYGLVLNRLPHALRNHCRDACLVDGVLTLFLDSPAWLTQARFRSDDLARSLQSEGVDKVVTQVRIESTEKARSMHLGDRGKAEMDQTVRNRLSDRTIAHLIAAAEAMPDPALANQFRRLAERHSRLAGQERTRLYGAGETPGEETG